MRILQLSWEYPPVVHGGLGRHVHALAEAQAAAGHDVVVLTQRATDPASASGSGSASGSDERVNDVRVLRVIPDPPDLPFDLEHLLPWVMGLESAMTRRGLLLARDWSPQVVHAHDWIVAHTATALAARFDVPLVTTVHATEAGRHQGWLPGPLSRAIHSVEWWLTTESDRLVVCSEAMREEVCMLFPAPGPPPGPGSVPTGLDVIPNGIDLARWSVRRARRESARARWQPSGDAPLVVFSGRLEWEKGVQTLVSAAPALRRRFPGIRVVVAGRGAQADALAAQARRLRLGRTVTFAGFLPEDELAALVAAADVAVVPSLYEPFGLVALEAAALGTPLVVADTGGLAELARAHLAECAFPARDPVALADAVTDVLREEIRDGSPRRRAARSRRRLRGTHTWGLVAEQTIATYRAAVRSHAAARSRVVGADGTDRPDRPDRTQSAPRVVRDGNLFA